MVAIKVKRNPPQQVIHPIPPHNGFGSEEDSILSVRYLDPHGKIRERVTRKFKRDKHILRFNAKLISPVPFDEERKFIISYYCRDDALQIFEIADRNSGRQSGKFMEKSRKKNPYSNKYYNEKDLQIGSTIYVNDYIFKLLECDEYTKKYMIDNAELFRDSDVTHVIERIRTSGAKYESLEKYLVDILKTIDPEGRHYVPKEEIKEGFIKLSLFLSPQEMITLIDNLSVNEKGEYSMEDLYNLIIC